MFILKICFKRVTGNLNILLDMNVGQHKYSHTNEHAVQHSTDKQTCPKGTPQKSPCGLVSVGVP